MKFLFFFGFLLIGFVTTIIGIFIIALNYCSKLVIGDYKHVLMNIICVNVILGVNYLFLQPFFILFGDFSPGLCSLASYSLLICMTWSVYVSLILALSRFVQMYMGGQVYKRFFGQRACLLYLSITGLVAFLPNIIAYSVNSDWLLVGYLKIGSNVAVGKEETNETCPSEVVSICWVRAQKSTTPAFTLTSTIIVLLALVMTTIFLSLTVRIVVKQRGSIASMSTSQKRRLKDNTTLLVFSIIQASSPLLLQVPYFIAYPLANMNGKTVSPIFTFSLFLPPLVDSVLTLVMIKVYRKTALMYLTTCKVHQDNGSVFMAPTTMHNFDR